MTHFTALLVFSGLVGIAFGALSSEYNDTRERVIYGLKVFGSFVGIGYGIAWVLFFLPR